MAPDPALEGQVRRLLRDTLDRADGPEPIWETSPAARRVATREGANRTGRAMRLLAVAALLAIAGASAALVGSWGSRADAIDPQRAEFGPIPRSLLGEWHRRELEGTGAPIITLDFGGPMLLHDQNGCTPSAPDCMMRVPPLPDRRPGRRAIGFIPTVEGAGVLVVDRPPPCSEERFLVTGIDQVQLQFAPLVDTCGDNAILTEQPWPIRSVQLTPGDAFGSLGFSEPFHFVMPDLPANELGVGLSQVGNRGLLRIGNVWWSGSFFDDQRLFVDMFDPGSGTLPDLPATPEALTAWLRANSKLGGASPTELVIDGRVALRFDTPEVAWARWPNETQEAGYGHPTLGVAHRVYLIPTADDVILFTVRGDLPLEEDIAEDVLRTITFD